MLGSRVCAGPKRLLLRRSWSLSSRTGTLTRSISSSQFCLANSASPSNRPSLSPVRSRQKANVATTVAVNSSAAEELSTARGPSPPASHVEAAKPFSDIPALKGWPVVGNIPQLIKLFKSGSFNKEYHKLQQELGPIFKTKGLGNDWTVVVSGADAAATLLRAEGKYPSRGKHEDNIMWIYKKNNKPYPMFFAGGSEWKKIRSAGTKQVLPQRVAKFVPPLCEIADDLMQQLEKHRDKDGNIDDIRDFTVKWSFQGVSYFVYGEKVNVYSGDPQLKEFMDIGLKFVRSIGRIAAALPLYRLHIKTEVYREYVDTLNRLQEKGKDILERHHSQLKEAIATGTVDDTKAIGLLDQWMIEGKYTEEEALVQSCDMLAAGMDTTSNTAMFLLFEMAKHPEVQDRMYEEIKSVMGDRKQPTWEDIQNMKLVRNTIKETMRLYLPVGILPRIINEDAVLNGYQVPAGTSVLFNMVSTGLDSHNFRNPEVFDPDRWNKKTTEDNITFTSLPFGFGPRMCYGRRLAELELYILLSKIIPLFHLSTDVKELELVQRTVLTSEKPVRIKMTPRQQQ